MFCHTVLCGAVFILYCGAMHTTLWCSSILYCVILYSSVLWCLPCEPYYTRASMLRSAVLYILFYNVQYHSPRQTMQYGRVVPYITVHYKTVHYGMPCSSIVWLTQKAPQHRRKHDGTIQYRAK